MSKNKRTLPMQNLRALVKESSLNEEARTVDVVFSTGAKGLRSFWGERFYEELSLDPEHVDLSRINDGSHPLLAAHDDQSLDSVIGVIERASTDGKVGTATVRFAKDEISERAFQKVKDGILRNISVGYSIQKVERYQAEGDEYETIRAVRWQPAEVSIVPIGFDNAAKIRNHETITENEVEILTRSDEQTGETVMTVKKDDLTPAVDAEALKKEAAASEKARAAGIRKEVRDAKLDESLADDLIERGLSVDEARTNVELINRALKKSEETKVDTRIASVEVGTNDMDKKRQGFEDALLFRMDAKNFSQSDAAKPFYGQSLLRMLETYIGRKTGETDAQFAKRSMQSSDLPLILANAAEKMAQKRYQLAERTWSKWAKTDTLRNYKSASQVRAGDFGTLALRAENADYATATIGEEGETAQLKDYGIIHSFSSKMIVNDDLKLIQKVMSEYGVSVARLENKLVYAALKTNKTMGDGTVLYHADHNNLGTPGVIGETTFAEAFLNMRSQMSVDGSDPLNIAPAFLIVGPSLEVAARKFLSTIVAAQTSNVNVFSNSVQLIVDAEISDDSYYFAADPNQIDTVTLFRLEGQEGPKVESRVKWENDAVELKVGHAAAAEPMDFRGLSKNEIA